MPYKRGMNSPPLPCFQGNKTDLRSRKERRPQHDGKRRRGSVRTGTAALGATLMAIALVANPVGATPFTGQSSGPFYSQLLTDDNGRPLYSETPSFTSGYSTLVGTVQCHSTPRFSVNGERADVALLPRASSAFTLIAVGIGHQGMLSAGVKTRVGQSWPGSLRPSLTLACHRTALVLTAS